MATMELALGQLLDHFMSYVANGKASDHELSKQMTRLACMTQSLHARLTVLRGKHPAKYEAYRARGLRDLARKDIVREHQGVSHLQLAHLRDRGLLTAEPGRDWYAAHFAERTLLEALTEAGLIDGCTREWIVRVFRVCSSVRSNALERARLLTQECGRDWYAAYFRDDELLYVLKKAGFMTRDTPVDWFERHFEPLKKHVEYSFSEWGPDRATAGGFLLCSALADAGHLAPGMGFGFDWCAARFDGDVLFGTLRRVGAFGVAADRNKAVARFKQTSHMIDMICDADAQLTAETKDWYSRHVPKCDVRVALKAAGLWNAALGKDWMAKHLMKIDVFAALVEFDMIGECSVEWIEANVGKRHVAEAIALRNRN